MASPFPISDEQLTGLLQAGDAAAFTVIYERYWDKLFIHALRMLREPEAAQDLMQELFINLWEKRETLSLNTSLSGYLYKAARNRVLNHIRAQNTRNEFISELAVFINQHAQPSAEPLQEQELAQAIEREIQNLPEKMREVFELSRKKELSYKEIAGELNISDKTVKKQVSNALKILRYRLGDLATIEIAFYLLKK